jgi:hypothetical protein
MTPEEHAKMGWDWGAYYGKTCLALTMDVHGGKELIEFMMTAQADGATVINLRAMRTREGKI